MATLLDQKEEVLKVELTKRGRKLLGLGIFQPEYYEFFDDSIIYDIAYTGLDEPQSSTQDRILDNSITLKALNLTDDLLVAPLGKSDIFNDYAPAWNLSVLNGQITFVQNSSSYYQNVFDTKNITYVKSLEKMNVSNVPNFNLSTFELEDGRVIDIKDDYILIDLQELNVEDEFENFEIEVSTFDELAGGKMVGLERKLFFQPKQSNILDGIIYSDDELPTKFKDPKLGKNDVEFYLDVLVDNEIDKEIITKAAKTVEEQVKATYTTTFEGAAKEDC